MKHSWLTLALLCVIFASCNNLFLMYLNNNAEGREQSRFMVIFNMNGGDREASPSRIVITLPENTIGILPFPPERDGYSFSGWNTEADGSGTVFNEATIVTNNITVFAQWN